VAAYVVIALAVAAAAFVAVFLLAGGGHRLDGSNGGTGGGSGAPVQLTGVGDYNPSASKDSHSSTAAAATDDNPSTVWYTQIYNSPDFGGLMDPYGGLGLLLDAGSPVKLASISVETPTPGFQAEIRAGSSPDGPFSPVSESKTVADSTTFTLDGTTAQYYVVWITSLPSTADGYKAEISEATAKS